MTGRVEIGAVIIGDELLSGKRRDRHQAALIDSLAEQGLELSWLRIVGDDAQLLTDTFRETLQRDAWVFSFGGIGATPDDRTRTSLARALGRSLVGHPEFIALLEARFGEDTYPNRVRMAELPEGSTLIPNPVNGIPGFACERHFCVPGFPAMAEPMVRWVLNSHLAGVAPAQRPAEMNLLLSGVSESRLVPLLEMMETRYPDLRISSLPGFHDGRPRVELGVRGEAGRAALAFEALQRGLLEAGLVARPGDLAVLPPRAAAGAMRVSGVGNAI